MAYSATAYRMHYEPVTFEAIFTHNSVFGHYGESQTINDFIFILDPDLLLVVHCNFLHILNHFKVMRLCFGWEIPLKTNWE